MQELKKMQGTGKNFDYAVVLESEDYQIGLKPLFDSQGPQTFVGMRIRLVPKNHETSVLAFKPKEQMLSYFPHIPWQQKNDTRLSLVGGCVVNIPYNHPEALHKWFREKNIVNVLLDKVKDMFFLDPFDNRKLLKDFYLLKLNKEYIKPMPLPKLNATNSVVSLGDYKEKLNPTDIDYIEEDT